MEDKKGFTSVLGQDTGRWPMKDMTSPAINYLAYTPPQGQASWASRPRALAGTWTIGGAQGLSFSVSKKPRWLTRKLCAWLLEWEWKDMK